MPRVVIVEDMANIRKEVVKNINRLPGWQVVGEHATGESALDCIAIERPDIVILDIGLPGVSGLDCLVRLKFELPKVIFAMFTIYDDDDNLFVALSLGASGYVLKDEGLSGILRALRELAQGRAYMSPAIATKVVQSFWKENVDLGGFQQLTNRQLQIVRMVSQGQSYKAIAEEIGISEGGVRQHLHRIYGIMHVNSRHKLAAMYQEVVRRLGPRK
ncbi:MAG: response regulator transcription factor [Bacteroidota bacterium]